MKISWQTILIIILAIILVLIAFFGGWASMISYIAPLVGSVTTAVYVAVAIVVAICIGIAALAATHPEWLQEIADAVGYTADRLSKSLSDFVKNTSAPFSTAITLGVITFTGIAGYLLFRSSRTDTSLKQNKIGENNG